jgi:hypothetical protein
VTHRRRRFNEGGLEGLLVDHRHGIAPGVSGMEEALRDALSREVIVNATHATEVVEGVCG